MLIDRLVLVGAVASVVAAAAGCASGRRLVARPTTAQQYRSAELRDISPMGWTDENVEIIGALGPPHASEICDGVVTFPLLSETMVSLANGVWPSTPDALGDAVATLSSGVTLTIPRERWPEVRDLSPFERVRVRGYLSTWLAEGCDRFSDTARRYLWVDSIERLP